GGATGRGGSGDHSGNGTADRAAGRFDQHADGRRSTRHRARQRSCRPAGPAGSADRIAVATSGTASGYTGGGKTTGSRNGRYWRGAGPIVSESSVDRRRRYPESQ